MRRSLHSLHSLATLITLDYVLRKGTQSSAGDVSASAASPVPTVTVAIAPRATRSITALTSRFVAAHCLHFCELALSPTRPALQHAHHAGPAMPVVQIFLPSSSSHDSCQDACATSHAQQKQVSFSSPRLDSAPGAAVQKTEGGE